MPSIFWNYLSFSSGIRIHEIVEKAMDPSNLDENIRSRNIETLTPKTKEVDRFVRSYLRCDGLFVLRMVEIHAGVLFGTDLILSLWNAFYEVEEKLSESRGSIDDYKENASNSFRADFIPNDLIVKEKFIRLRKPIKELKVHAEQNTVLLPLIPENPQNGAADDI
uniref:Bm8586 n=1 Tax=Brugia malayi TaxID=6279 RepID=A0A1I9G820_BRUMA|nr:Bm8586 [Brugia malayi]